MDLEWFEDWMTNNYHPHTVKKYLRDMRRGLRLGLDPEKFLKKPYKLAPCLQELQLPIHSRNNLAMSINAYLKAKVIHFKLKKLRVKGKPDRFTPTDEQVTQLYALAWEKPRKVARSADRADSYYTARNQMLLKMVTIPALRCDEARSRRITDFRTKLIDTGESKTRFLVMYLLQSLAKEYTFFEQPDQLKKYLGSFIEEMKRLESKQKKVTVYYVNVIGKGRKERNVIIPKEFYDEIHEYFRWYHRSSDYLFDNRTGAPISTNTVRKICSVAGAAISIPQFHPHAGRRWRAGYLWRCKIKVDSISSFLGHESVDTTLKHYLDMIQDDDRYQDITQLDPLFNLAGLVDLMIKEPKINHPFNELKKELEALI